MRGRYLGHAALSGRHGRSSWWVPFGARAYLCATEHLREVTSDAADCLGLDQRRQWDELLKAAREMPENYEDLTSQLGHPQPVEVPTEPLREPEEPSHDDMDAVEQMTPAGRSWRKRVINRNRTAIHFVGWASGKYWTVDSSRNPVWRNDGKTSVQKGSRDPLKMNRRKPERTKQNQSVLARYS